MDLTRLLPGDLATQLLADLGAEVIKVEEPQVGDYMRHLGPMVDGMGYPFLLLNQGKKSVAVDLKTEAGQDLVHRLVPSADLVVEQFRPGVAARLGVDYERLRPLREDIVYCSFSGFGREGPYRDRPAHDLNFYALSGGLHMTGRGDRPSLPGVPVADVAAGYLAAFAMVAALLHRERTGEGSHLDLAIFDALPHLNVLNLAEVFGGRDPGPGDTFPTGLFPFYEVYETADGRFLTLGALEEKFWHRLCGVLGRPEWKEHHLATGRKAEELREALSEAFRGRSLDEWSQRLTAADVPHAAVLRPAEVPEDRHVRARNLIGTLNWEGRRVSTLAHPVRWGEGAIRRRGPPPRLGAHTESVLREAGVEPARIQELLEEGVLRQPRG